MNGSEPVLVVAIGPVSAQFAPVAEPEDELPEPADEPVLAQQDEDDELPELVEELPVLDPEGVHCGVFDADTLWTPDCP